jgi:hypothetical protein
VTQPNLTPDNTGFVAEATICSILPREDGQPFTVANRTHGVYRIYHPGNGESFALTHIPWKKDYADVGDYDPAYTRRSGIEKRKEFTFTARQIAEDICKEINSNGPGDASFFGVFVCNDTKGPTVDELQDATTRLETYFRQTVAAADSQWSNIPRHDLISGIAKRGARWLKVEREWLSNYAAMVECPACGDRIRPYVAVCKSCGAILDRKKAEEFGLLEKKPKEIKTT